MAITRRPVSRKKPPVPTATPAPVTRTRRTVKEGVAPRGSTPQRAHRDKLGALSASDRKKIEQKEMEELYHNYGSDYRQWRDTGLPSGVFGQRVRRTSPRVTPTPKRRPVQRGHAPREKE
jgi:hypothetical protein